MLANITNLISYLFGAAARLKLPRIIARWSVLFYVRLYSVDTEEIEFSLRSYKNLQAFFVRNLKAGSRPISENKIVSPADGKLAISGEIREEAQLIQAKGKYYSADELLGAENRDLKSRLLLDGSYLQIYLSPRDYHHVHSPVDGAIVARAHIEGSLFPVNNWACKKIGNLFLRNERVVLFIESDSGLFALVMVGALNVGSISLSFEGLQTNKQSFCRLFRRPRENTKNFQPGLEIRKGQRLGTFNLGSTVILLSEKYKFIPPSQMETSNIQYATSLD